MEFGLLLRLADVMNLILISFHPFSIQGREPYFHGFIEKNQNWLVFRHLLFSFKLDMVVEITKLYIFISVLMTLAFIEGHSCMRNQKHWCPFSCTLRYQNG